VEEIKVREKEQTADGWEFLVEVGSKGNGLEYLVMLDKEYWEELTDNKYTPKELVIKSFRFLLEREEKRSILKKFNLYEISRYFPEYESEIRG